MKTNRCLMVMALAFGLAQSASAASIPKSCYGVLMDFRISLKCQSVKEKDVYLVFGHGMGLGVMGPGAPTLNVFYLKATAEKCEQHFWGTGWTKQGRQRYASLGSTVEINIPEAGAAGVAHLTMEIGEGGESKLIDTAGITRQGRGSFEEHLCEKAE